MGFIYIKEREFFLLYYIELRFSVPSQNLSIFKLTKIDNHTY